MASSKGITIPNKMFMVIVILLGIVFLLAMYLLLNRDFVAYITDKINSNVKLCETFERNPLYGTIFSKGGPLECPKTAAERYLDVARTVAGSPT